MGETHPLSVLQFLTGMRIQIIYLIKVEVTMEDGNRRLTDICPALGRLYGEQKLSLHVGKTASK